jgi:hypothetical protein
MDEKTQKKLKDEVVESVDIAKGFHLYERRNEWVNWNGDTSLVSRSGCAVKLTLSDAEQSAEKWRMQGTKFFIDEVPILLVKSRSGALILTELFSDRPMWWYLSKMPSIGHVKTIGSLMNALPQTQWGIQSLAVGPLSITAPDGTYFSRASSPGKGKNYMAWTTSVRLIS